jgi:hypothetical protein
MAQKKQERIDNAYAAYHDTVNMSASELEAWADTPASKKASESRAPVRRNLKLLRKPKAEWTLTDAKQANRTVSFVSRMRGNERGRIVAEQGGREYSKRDISLKNWAFDPFK